MVQVIKGEKAYKKVKYKISHRIIIIHSFGVEVPWGSGIQSPLFKVWVFKINALRGDRDAEHLIWLKKYSLCALS